MSKYGRTVRRCLMLAAALAVPQMSLGAELFWDANGGGSGVGGNGTWHNPNTWRDGSTTGTLGNWVDGNVAVLPGNSASTITVGQDVELDALIGLYNYTLNSANDARMTLVGNAIVLSDQNRTVNINVPIDGTAGLQKINTTLGGASNNNGKLFLNTANTYTGETVIQSGHNDGGLFVTANGALGAVGEGNGTRIIGGGNNPSLVFQNVNYTDPEPVFIETSGPTFGAIQSNGGASVFHGPITAVVSGNFYIGARPGSSLELASTVTMASDRTLLLNANASATGTIILSGDNSAVMQGSITMNRGILVVRHSGALGSVSETTIGPASGTAAATLQLDGGDSGLVIAEQFKLMGGQGVGGNGVIRNISGNNTLTGALNLRGVAGGSADTTNAIQVDAGSSLTLTGRVSPQGNGSNVTLYLQGDGTGIVPGQVDDAGVRVLTIVKRGAGTWSFDRAAGNTYTGGTTVEAGTLLVNNASGSGTGSGAVLVQEGARLGGSGRITGDVTLAAASEGLVGGILMPTSLIDPLDLGALVLEDGAALDLSALSGLDSSSTYTVVTYSSLAGSFSQYIGKPGTHEVNVGLTSVELVPVPEPGSLSLLALGALGLLRRRRH